MKEDLIIYRLAKPLGKAIAFLLRHQAAIAATTLFVLVFTTAYVVFKQKMITAYALLSATGSSILVSAFVLIRCRDRGDE